MYFRKQNEFQNLENIFKNFEKFICKDKRQVYTKERSKKTGKINYAATFVTHTRKCSKAIKYI